MTQERTFMVTAATTSLGQHVVRRLAERGRVVTVRSSREPAPPAGEPESCVADLTHTDDVRRVVGGLAAQMNVDTIVHLGSSGMHAEQPGASHATSTRLLLDAAERTASVRSFVLRSTAEIYRARSDDPVIVDERHPLDFSTQPTPRQRDWLEADVTASQRMANASLRIAILRLSEVLAPDIDSDLLDYLRLPVLLRPMGFDPMINLLSIGDAAQAVALAAESTARGIFNVGGADTLPLSELMHRLKSASWAIPGAFIDSMYALSKHKRGHSAALRALLHYGRVLDGRAAMEAFGYRPTHPVAWERMRAR